MADPLTLTPNVGSGNHASVALCGTESVALMSVEIDVRQASSVGTLARTSDALDHAKCHPSE